MIGTLPLASSSLKLSSALKVPAVAAKVLAKAPVMIPKPALPLSSVTVTGKYANVPPPAAPPIVAQAVIPAALAKVPALPPPPADRPVVQAGKPIPALAPAAPITTIAPGFYARVDDGQSEVSDPPPGNVRLPAPYPFATAALSDPIFPVTGLDLAPADASIAEAAAAAPSTVASSSSSSSSSPAPKWMWAAAGVAALALAGGVAFGLRRKGRKR